MAYLRNIWYAAIWAADLTPGSIVGRIFLEEKVVLFRHEDGTPGALEDMCAHRFAPLSMGRLTAGNLLRCPYHGLAFDGTGACAHNPHGDGRIPATAKVRSYPLAERHGMVWIWMGDRPADPDRIPDFSLLDPGNEVSRREWLIFDADYGLIVDNLLDLSHTCFLHEGVLGNAQTIDAESELIQTETSLFVGRFSRNVPVPRLHDLMFRRDGQPVDYWSDMKWHAPSCLINSTGVTRPGAPRSEGTGVFGTHLLTPGPAGKTYYHFAGVRWNPVRWGEAIEQEIMEQIAVLRRNAFEFEDKLVIEAQQRNLEHYRDRDLRPMILSIDTGPVRWRQIMDKLMRAEGQ